MADFNRKNSMLVRQAIVSSRDPKLLQENELISRSVNIDDELGEALCRWSPSRNELAYGIRQSINFFQPDADTFALSRSVIGGIEDNRDGDREIVSRIILFDREQLSGYHNNIGLVAHVLGTNGRMILPTSVSNELPMLEIPASAFLEKAEFSRPGFDCETERIVHALDIHRRVVIVGLNNPLPFICSFLADIPTSTRLDFGFATGLKIKDDRPFPIQFFPESDPALMQDLASRQVRTISLESNPLAACS